MRLLLDTHVFLWWVADHPSLSPLARNVIADADNDCLVRADGVMASYGLPVLW